MTVAVLALLLQTAAKEDRAVESRQYSTGTAAQLEMSTFSGNYERQARWLLKLLQVSPRE